jgi:iron(III) transport system permease protein
MATTVMLLMSVAAWIVVRTNARGRGLLDNMSFWPIVYPSLVLGLAILILYLRVPLPIYGTLLILFVAYVTKYMPYGMRFASTSMYQIHREVEEAAGVAGASWWQGFRRVILPLIAPGFIAGWIYIAMIAVRELGSSVLLYSPGSEVLSIAMFRMYFEGRMNEMAALGVLLILGLTVMAMIAYKIGQRFGVSEQSAAGVK